MTGTLASGSGPSRDARLDLLRGLAIVFVVINHIDQPSLWHLLTVERVGLVTGAEIFVLLSGVVLGIVHRRRTARAGWTPSLRALLRRSLTLYLTSVMVVLAVFLLRFLPRLDDQSLTTYDRWAYGAGVRPVRRSRSSRGPVPWGSPACLRPR